MRMVCVVCGKERPFIFILDSARVPIFGHVLKIRRRSTQQIDSHTHSAPWRGAQEKTFDMFSTYPGKRHATSQSEF